MYGIIDIGSNTIRLSIYKRTEKDFQLMINKKHMTGLAGYVDHKGILSERGIKKAIEDLADFRQIIEKFELKDIYVFATASLRNVRNTELALKQIGSQIGVPVDLVSGEQEAVYDFIGATRFMNMNSGLLIDIGGGSTELVSYANGNIVEAISLPIGSLSLYSNFVSEVLPTGPEIKAMKAHIKSHLEGVTLNGHGGVLCGIGGTCRAVGKMGNMVYDLPSTNRRFEISQIQTLYKRVVKDRKGGIRIAVRAVPDRLHTIVPGMLILHMVEKKFTPSELVISDYGVREGYLYKKLVSGEIEHVK